MPTQPEQMGNARKMQELECSIYVENPKQLRSAVNEIEENRETYKSGVEKLNQYSRDFNGLENAINIIEDIKT